MGHNEIHHRFLWEMMNAAAKTLFIISQKSLQPGKVPIECKKGNMLPIF